MKTFKIVTDSTRIGYSSTFPTRRVAGEGAIAHFENISRTVLGTAALFILLSACGGGGGGGTSSGSIGGSSGPPDNTVPTVTGITPGEDTFNTGTNSLLTATFSEPVVSAAISAHSFRVTDGVDAIAGTVSYDDVNHIAIFAPASALMPNTRYTATVITGIKDLAGNPLMTDFAWCFVTAGMADSIAPSVTSTIPANADTGVPVNWKVAASFSEAMNSSSLTAANFRLTGPGSTPVSGTVTYLGGKAIFAPVNNLLPGTTYTATVTPGAVDLAGNVLQANQTWSFTTGTGSDVVAPFASSTSPANSETNVAIGRVIAIRFNEPMNPGTITSANLSVTAPGATPVIGTVAYDVSNNTATFTRINHLTTPVIFHPTPVSDLEPNTAYTATLTTGAKDMAGNAVTQNTVWSFTTAP